MTGGYHDLPAAGRETADHRATERPAATTDDGDPASPNNHNASSWIEGPSRRSDHAPWLAPLAAIIALLVVGLAGFLIANNAAQINPSQVAPIQLPAGDRTEPVAAGPDRPRAATTSPAW